MNAKDGFIGELLSGDGSLIMSVLGLMIHVGGSIYLGLYMMLTVISSILYYPGNYRVISQ